MGKEVGQDSRPFSFPDTRIESLLERGMQEKASAKTLSFPLIFNIAAQLYDMLCIEFLVE